MIRHFARFRAQTLACLAVVLFVPLAAYGQVDAVDLTASFIDGSVTIDRLLVYQIGGVVLIRGRTGDPLMSAEAERFARRAGYRRVANLIEIVPGLADDALVDGARHELDMARELEGCRFQIEAVDGIVRLRGQVRREVQKDYAMHLIGKIDGVKEVRSELTLTAPAGRQR
jgi:osmotically-inducible protein OsmY